MISMKRLAAGVASAVLATAMATAAVHAQETSSGINGTARTTSGAPIANAPVTVVYEPTNQTFSTHTDASGLFSIRQLPPGGPYRVTVTGPNGPVTQEVQNIGLG